MKKIYNKLVRDNIPSIIESEGKKCNYRIIKDKTEVALLLCDKIIEEANELKTALITNKGVFEELVDVSEVANKVVSELINSENVDEVIDIHKYKRKTKGAFEKHIYLESVED